MPRVPPKPRRRKGESQRSYDQRLRDWNSQKLAIETGPGGTSLTDSARLAAANQALAQGAGPGGMGFLGFGKDELVPAAILQNAQYKDGAQWEPANWHDPAQIADLQDSLVAAGFVGEKGLSRGVWDERSAKALAGAMGAANRQGQSVDETIADAIAGGGNGGGGGRGSNEKQVVRLENLVTGGETRKKTSGEELHVAMTNVFENVLGRKMNDEEVLRFGKNYQDMEVWAQAIAQTLDEEKARTAWQAGIADDRQAAAVAQAEAQNPSGPGVTEVGGREIPVRNQELETPPSPEVYAEWVARTKYPAEFEAYKIAKNHDRFMNLLQGSSPGAANWA